MVKVMLDLKIEIPNVDPEIDQVISFELNKDLEKISNHLADKAAKIIERYNRLRIYNEGA